MNKHFTLLIFVVLLFSFCSKKKEQTFLSENEFTRIIYDIHLTDGVLTTKNIINRGDDYRPSFYYNSIYKKYNISPQQFDSCVSFYTQNSTLYEKMYERVIDSLNRLETQFRITLKDSLIERDTVNLWKGKKDILLRCGQPVDLSFSIPLKEMGIYTVRAKIKRFKDDRSKSPFLRAFFWKEDSLKKSTQIYFDSIPVNYSDEFLNYETQLEFSDSTIKELRGNILVWNNGDRNFTQHIHIKDVMIFNPQIKRDSIGLDSLVKFKIR